MFSPDIALSLFCVKIYNILWLRFYWILDVVYNGDKMKSELFNLSWDYG